MEITAYISYEQYRDAFAAIRGAGKKRRNGQEMLILAMSAFAIAMLLIIPSYRTPTVWLLAAMAPLLYGCKLWSKRRYDRCLRDFFERNKANMNGQIMNVDEHGISGIGSNKSFTYSYEWSSFSRCIEMRDGFLFLPTPDTFVRVPFDSLSPEDRRQILTWSSSVPHSIASLKT